MSDVSAPGSAPETAPDLGLFRVLREDGSVDPATDPLEEPVLNAIEPARRRTSETGRTAALAMGARCDWGPSHCSSVLS